MNTSNLASDWWASLPNGACVNAMWEEAAEANVPYEDRLTWLYERYGATVR